MRLSAGGYGVHNGKRLVGETLVVGTVGAVDAVCAEAERCEGASRGGFPPSGPKPATGG